MSNSGHIQSWAIEPSPIDPRNRIFALRQKQEYCLCGHFDFAESMWEEPNRNVTQESLGKHWHYFG